MSARSFVEFPQAVVERLGSYVYVLRDPRDGVVFYVGKGTANRVFAHANDSLDVSRESDKLDRIRAIAASGQCVSVEIVRHGLTADQALEVESALIDFIGLERLHNLVQGHRADDRGRMTLAEIVATYGSKPVQITEPSILITVNKLFHRNIDDDRLYEITRGNWVVGTRRNSARYGIAVFRGLVRAVYVIETWEPCEARSPQQKNRNRWRFSGSVATDMQHLIGGDVSALIRPGAQNPISYVNC